MEFQALSAAQPIKTTLENAGLSHWVTQPLFRGSPCPYSGTKKKNNNKKKSTFANQQELPVKWEWNGPQIKNLLDFVLHPKSSISKERFMLLQNRVGFGSRKRKNAFYLPEWQSSAGTRKKGPCLSLQCTIYCKSQNRTFHRNAFATSTQARTSWDPISEGFLKEERIGCRLKPITRPVDFNGVLAK